jgi:hypothetical protein
MRGGMDARSRVTAFLRLFSLVVVAVVAAGCSLLPPGLKTPGDDPPATGGGVTITDELPVVDIGESRSELTARLGEPAERSELVKRDEGIFGPIEAFWGEVPLGATVEIWVYPVPEGALEVYFVDRSNTVRGSAFAPAGVVY